MLWDSATQRFYYSAVYYDSLFFSDNGIAIGWSKTATPSSAADFCQYVLTFGSQLPDYPKLGDSADFLIYGYNGFSSFASSYDGSGFVVVNKPLPGTTCPPTSAFTVTESGVLHNSNGSLAATPVPANLVDDNTGAGYVVANADLTTTSSANFISVYSVTKNGVDANGIPIAKITGPTTVSVPSRRMLPRQAAPTCSTRSTGASKRPPQRSTPATAAPSRSGRRTRSSGARGRKSAGTRSTRPRAPSCSRVRRATRRCSRGTGRLPPTARTTAAARPSATAWP
jgi:hypothetical protein